MIRIALAATFGAVLFLGASEARAQDGDTTPVKHSGVIRIGIVKPQIKMGSEELPGVSDSVREILAEYLRGPTIDVALLDARLASQYAIEAEQTDCDFILVASLTHERGRMNEMLGRALGNLAYYAPRLPGGNTATSAIMSGVLYTVADFARSIKAKDRMELEYRLSPVGVESSVLADTAVRRAKSDGEDLLTPLVESAAETIGAAVTARGATRP